MPLKLIPPRPPSHPNYSVRGTYLGVRIYRSTGTADKRLATQLLAKWRRDIESGALTNATGPTFSGAVKSYVQSGGDSRFLVRLHEHFRDIPLAQITQAAIDEVAVTLYPNATAATRNRQVYSPVSAVLRHAGHKIDLVRPRGSKGNPRTTFLSPDEAFSLLGSAGALNPRFEALCTFLLYTGARLSEGLTLRWDDVDLPRATAYIRKTKTGEPRTVFLPEVVVASLANLTPLAAGTGPAKGGRVVQERSPRIFGYAKSGRLYQLFNKAAAAAGLEIEERVSFHIFRHTYAAWLRRYAGMDIDGLLATGAWKSRQAAAVYQHVDVSHEARKAALLPTRKAR